MEQSAAYGVIIHEHFLALVLTLGLGVSSASADCKISDAGLEEAILKKPEFRDPANRQMVRDLRRLRDSAFILGQSYALVGAQSPEVLADAIGRVAREMAEQT